MLSDPLLLPPGVSLQPGVDRRLGRCPTPRFEDGCCFLAPRQQPYTQDEIALHLPGRVLPEPVLPGFACPRCDVRGMKRGWMLTRQGQVAAYTCTSGRHDLEDPASRTYTLRELLTRLMGLPARAGDDE